MRFDKGVIPYDDRLAVKWNKIAPESVPQLNLEILRLYIAIRFINSPPYRDTLMVGAALHDFEDLANNFGPPGEFDLDLEKALAVERTLNLRLPQYMRIRPLPKSVKTVIRDLKDKLAVKDLRQEAGFCSARESYHQAFGRLWGESGVVTQSPKLGQAKHLFVRQWYVMNGDFFEFKDKKVAELGLAG